MSISSNNNRTVATPSTLTSTALSSSNNTTTTTSPFITSLESIIHQLPKSCLSCLYSVDADPQEWTLLMNAMEEAGILLLKTLTPPVAAPEPEDSTTTTTTCAAKTLSETFFTPTSQKKEFTQWLFSKLEQQQEQQQIEPTSTQQNGADTVLFIFLCALQQSLITNQQFNLIRILTGIQKKLKKLDHTGIICINNLVSSLKRLSACVSNDSVKRQRQDSTTSSCCSYSLSPLSFSQDTPLPIFETTTSTSSCLGEEMSPIGTNIDFETSNTMTADSDINTPFKEYLELQIPIVYERLQEIILTFETSDAQPKVYYERLYHLISALKILLSTKRSWILNDLIGSVCHLELEMITKWYTDYIVNSQNPASSPMTASISSKEPFAAGNTSHNNEQQQQLLRYIEKGLTYANQLIDQVHTSTLESISSATLSTRINQLEKWSEKNQTILDKILQYFISSNNSHAHPSSNPPTETEKETLISSTTVSSSSSSSKPSHDLLSDHLNRMHRLFTKVHQSGSSVFSKDDFRPFLFWMEKIQNMLSNEKETIPNQILDLFHQCQVLANSLLES